MTSFEMVTAAVRDADGAEGIGYTDTVGTSGLAVATLIDRYTPTGSSCWQRMWWALHYGGRGGPVSLATSAVDIALWDLKARRFGTPLWRLLGGNDPRVPVYVGGVDLYLPLPNLLKDTDANLARGFRAIKTKVGREKLSEDVERIRAMRKHLGSELPLMVDADMAWTVGQALRAARALEPYDLYWMEEPTIPDDFAGHARIAHETKAPIAAGENLHSLYEFRQGAHDITVHLLAAVPNRSFLELHAFALDRFIRDPLAIEKGVAVAPDCQGHGVQFNWAALSEYRTA